MNGQKKQPILREYYIMFSKCGFVSGVGKFCSLFRSPKAVSNNREFRYTFHAYINYICFDFPLAVPCLDQRPFPMFLWLVFFHFVREVAEM